MRATPAFATVFLCLISLVWADSNQVRRRSDRVLQACAVFPPNTIYHIAAVHSGLNIGVQGTTVGSSVVQIAPGTGSNDNWRFVAQSNGFFHVISNSGLAMAVDGGSENNGADIVQVAPSQDGSTDWCFLDQGNGVYKVQNRKSEKSLDAASSGKTAGSNIHQWSYWGGSNQKFTVQLANEGPVAPTTPPGPATAQPTGVTTAECGDFPPNTVFHIAAVHSGLNIGVEGASSGASVVQIAPGTGPNDNWRFVAQPNGFFHVIGTNGLAMAVENGSTANGANVVQTAASQDGTTDWCFRDQGNNQYQVENRKSGKSLDAASSGKTAGSNIHQWSFWGGGNQKFTVQLANEQPADPSAAPVTAAPVTAAPVTAAPFTAAPVTAAPVTTAPITPITITPSPVTLAPVTLVPVTLAPVTLAPVTLAPSPIPPPPSGGTCETCSDWEGPIDTPVIAVAAANLPDGRIVMWSAYLRNMYGGDGGTQTWTATYNPASGSITEKLVKTNHDMFCPGTATLSDGRVMITGGSNSEATTFFDYRDNNWSIGPKMKISRGYHSMTVLADGSVFTCGGSWSGGWSNKDGELWSPSNIWRVLSGVPDDPFVTNDKAGLYRADNHFWLFLAPNGKVFHAGPSRQMNWVTTSGVGSVEGSINRGDDSDAMNGNALMYDIGKILTVGGAPHYDSGSSSNRAYIIDINGPEVSVTRTGNMQYRRALHNSVLLPSGEVVVIGGRESPGDLFSDKNSILHAEIWSPDTGSFKTLKQMDIPRNYHSVALLMKDGRVWAAGGGLCGGCSVNHQDFEILTPPYLYNADGSLATQPVIVDAPGSVKAGGTISVQLNSAQNHSFSLVRVSAVTHSVNNDQRRIPLEVVSKSGSSFSLKLPSNKNVSLVGVYYLFAMNEDGVPSAAKDIRIAL